jgi:hypothetical protein
MPTAPHSQRSQFQANVAVVAAACDRELDLLHAALGHEYFYQSLPLCVIDAVYSIGVRYSGVRNVLTRYCTYFGLQEFRSPPNQVPPQDEQESLPAFVGKMNKFGIAKFTSDVFKNRQRTSARNGILKAEAVLRFATVLTAHGVKFLHDVPPRVGDLQLDAALRSVPGQRSGISVSYFFMLAGDENFVKPDRWIGRFLNRRLGYVPGSAEAQSLVAGACTILRAKYPHLTPRLLDYAIWNFERNR